MADATTDRYDALRARVSGAVARLCPSWLAGERDDLTQAAMMRLFKVLPDEGTGAVLSSYVWKTAFSVTIDEIRSRTRRRETPLDADDASSIARTDAPSPERAAMGRELGRSIRRCLASLARRRRAAVVLFLLGHTVRDTGARLGWNEKKAENLMYRGLADLRSCLAAKGLRP